MNYERYVLSTGMLSTNPAIYSEEYYAGSDAESFYDPRQYNHLGYPESPRQPERRRHAPAHEKSSSWEADELGRIHHVYHGHIREIDEESTDKELDGSYHDMLSGEDQDTFAHILTDPLPSRTTPPPTPIIDPGMVYYLRSIEYQQSHPQISPGAHNGYIAIEDSGYMSGRGSSSCASSPVSRISNRSTGSRIPNRDSTPSPQPSILLYGSCQATERPESFYDTPDAQHTIEFPQIIQPRPIRVECPEFLESMSRPNPSKDDSTLGVQINVYHITAEDLQGASPGISERKSFAQIHGQPSTVRSAVLASTNRGQKEDAPPNRPPIAGASNSQHGARVEEVNDEGVPSTRKVDASSAQRLFRHRARPQAPTTQLQPHVPASRPSTPVPISRQLPEILRRAPSPTRDDLHTHPAPHSTRRSNEKERPPPHVSNHTVAWHALNLVDTALKDIRPLNLLHLEGALCAVQNSLYRQRSISHNQWVVHSFEWYEKYNERVRLIEALVGWVKQSISKIKTTKPPSSELLGRLSNIGTLLFDIASKLHASFDRLERRYQHILKATSYPPRHQVRAKNRAERLAAVHGRARDEADRLSMII